MRYRLKIKTGKARWKLGIIVYDAYKNAKVRQDELLAYGIISKIVNELGGELV